MINVSTATKNAYLNHSASNQLYIYFPNLNLTLTNSDIVAESMNLSQIIESESVLTFKGCNASKFEIELVDLEQDVRGEQIIVSIQAGSTDSIVLFKGTVDDQNNINHEDITVKITAYDELYSVAQNDVTDWYAGLTFPMTVQQFRYSFFSHIGISQETVTLPCDDLQMSRMVSSDVALNVLKVMQDICQANARFGLLRNGLFSYVKLSDTTETAISKNTYNNVDYDPYTMEAITKVSVADDSGVTEESYGSGTNILKIEGNIVAYSVDRAECAERIYNEVSGITMNSARVDLIGLPYLECGDYITLSTSKNDLEMYILNRTLKGIQALTDNYSSTIDKYQHEVNSVESQLITRDGRMNHFYRDLEQTNSTIVNNKADADGKFTQQQTAISQNAESISAEILRAQGAENTLSNTITATADALTVQIEEIYAELDGEIAVYYREGEPTLLNYPAWDFTYNIPCNNTVQTTNSLKFIYTDEYYQENIRDLVYDTNSNLTYRFEKEDGAFYWKPIADTDFSVAMQKISELEVATDNISASVSATTTELHSDYYTKTQTEGKISVSAGEVLSTVAETYTNSSDLAANYTKQSTFNQTVNGITASISAEQIARQEGDDETFTSALTEISASANSILSTVSETYETKAHSTSSINQKADEILSTVSTTYETKAEASSSISQTANEIKAQVQSSDKVWDTSISGTHINVDYVFYAPNLSTEPSPFNIGKYYLNQQTGTLWWRNANNKYSRQLSVLYNSASSSFTMQSAEIALKVSTDELATEIKAIPGGLTLDTGELIINSNSFHLLSNGTGNLGGLSFDSRGFYSKENDIKILQVHPNPSDGWALSVCELIYRQFLEESGSILYPYYRGNYPFAIGHEGECYITNLQVKNEYSKSGPESSPTFTKIADGNLTVDNLIQCYGNIEIGPSEYTTSRDLRGGSLYVRIGAGGGGDYGNVVADNYIYATGRGSGIGDIEAAHDLIYGNSCHQSSDKRLKEDIKDLENSEEFIYSLRPVSYRFKDNDKELHRGFIAQEVEQLLEEDSAIVGENPRTKYKTLAYTEIIADLVKTVQLQNERIKALEEKIAGLEEIK